MLEATTLAIGAALTCLAQNIYFESRDQSTIGQIAIAEVTLNRVADPRWPNDICSVVKQGPTYKWKKTYPIKHRCEFSWYCDGKSDTPKDRKAWLKSVEIAKYVHGNYGNIQVVDDATYFHATYVDPGWKKLEKIVTIGDHIFYRQGYTMPKRKKSGGHYVSKGQRRNVSRQTLKAVRRDRSVVDRMLDKQAAEMKR